MSSEWSVAQLLAAVQRSPELVAAHDRAGWCGLYSGDGEVNDPVGSRPHRGRAAIERFYDTFIAPNDIRFQVAQDIVCGMTVVRDLEVETLMSTGLRMRVPMHLRYDLVEADGSLKIRRLCAHWELPGMIRQMLGKGFKGHWTSLKLGPQMLRHQGLGGMLGFMRGFAGVGHAGKRGVAEFLHAAGHGEASVADALLAPETTLEMPAGRRLGRADFIDALRGAEAGKMLASGRSVTVSLKLGSRRGVALFQFEPGQRLPGTVQVFV
jgi:hypothetical protein